MGEEVATESRCLMPYLNCRKCRLQVYSAAAYSTVDRCPRCEALLSSKPPRLFACPAADGQVSAKAGDGGIARALAEVQSRALAEVRAPRGASDSTPSQASHSSGDGRHGLIREALTDTGVFRDGRGSQSSDHDGGRTRDLSP